MGISWAYHGIYRQGTAQLCAMCKTRIRPSDWRNGPLTCFWREKDEKFSHLSRSGRCAAGLEHSCPKFNTRRIAPTPPHTTTVFAALLTDTRSASCHRQQGIVRTCSVVLSTAVKMKFNSIGATAVKMKLNSIGAMTYSGRIPWPTSNQCDVMPHQAAHEQTLQHETVGLRQSYAATRQTEQERPKEASRPPSRTPFKGPPSTDAVELARCATNEIRR